MRPLVRGFLLLYTVASLKPLRSRSLRWADEQKRQEEWLARVVEIAREDVPLIVIQRQLGHSNLGITSIYLQGIDNAEIIETVRARRQPMIPVSTSLRR